MPLNNEKAFIRFDCTIGTVIYPLYARDRGVTGLSQLSIDPIFTRDFIIFYDRTLTNPQQLITASQKLGTELLYEYQNLNAIAVHIPEK
ncbi:MULTISPECIES: hypothetical protein [unclassified Avibacterium]|uniref:hypothetical protein n=1 Tax=unclassified Avibacterium TaxID=2685287 RepID=UPI0021898033|nr:hypothetical protein [Avibacterium sp. 20-129]MCW9699455.1 hypothetical protein [Avibacterium sp. 20-129]URL01495.1 hypothetical protein L4F91_08105 [Avibacterium sp. 20-126]